MPTIPTQRTGATSYMRRKGDLTIKCRRSLIPAAAAEDGWRHGGRAKGWRPAGANVSVALRRSLTPSFMHSFVNSGYTSRAGWARGTRQGSCSGAVVSGCNSHSPHLILTPLAFSLSEYRAAVGVLKFPRAHAAELRREGRSINHAVGSWD